MFTDKVIIVTGVAGNVGGSAARLLAERGGHVVAVDYARDPLLAAAAALPRADRHLACPGVDMTKAEACAAVVAAARQRFGRLDGVVTTVGGFAMGKVDGDDLWDRMLSMNVRTTWNIYRAAIPELRAAGGGALVGVGSVAGLKAGAEVAAYAASKAAVLRLTESLADELRGDRIRVNAVMPTTIDTPQNRAAMPAADTSRWVTPDQVAEAMLFLLSDAASGVTGALLQVG